MKFKFLSFTKKKEKKEKKKENKVLKIKIIAVFFYQFVLKPYITDYLFYRYESMFICWRYEFK